MHEEPQAHYGQSKRKKTCFWCFTATLIKCPSKYVTKAINFCCDAPWETLQKPAQFAHFKAKCNFVGACLLNTQVLVTILQNHSNHCNMRQPVFENTALQRGKGWMYFTHQHDLFYYCAFFEN